MPPQLLEEVHARLDDAGTHESVEAIVRVNSEKASTYVWCFFIFGFVERSTQPQAHAGQRVHTRRAG